LTATLPSWAEAMHETPPTSVNKKSNFGSRFFIISTRIVGSSRSNSSERDTRVLHSLARMVGIHSEARRIRFRLAGDGTMRSCFPWSLQPVRFLFRTMPFRLIVEQFGLACILPHFLTSLGERPLLPGVSVDVSSRYGQAILKFSHKKWNQIPRLWQYL
jgi:hypothetical protein